MKEQNADIMGGANYSFWELCEPLFRKVVNSRSIEELTNEINCSVANIVLDLYNRFCPFENARQIVAWAKCQPHLGKYLKNHEKEEVEVV